MFILYTSSVCVWCVLATGSVKTYHKRKRLLYLRLVCSLFARVLCAQKKNNILYTSTIFIYSTQYSHIIVCCLPEKGHKSPCCVWIVSLHRWSGGFCVYTCQSSGFQALDRAHTSTLKSGTNLWTTKMRAKFTGAFHKTNTPSSPVNIQANKHSSFERMPGIWRGPYGYIYP